MKIWILIFLGGGLGSLFRYLISRWIIGTFISDFPYGTLVVNITGCFLIGFFIFYFTEDRFGVTSLPWRLFLVTGICGGYTTFSAFSFENVKLLDDKHVIAFLTYTFGSVLLGLLATYSGIFLAKII